ncbi:hypothetical protein BDZ85DRAFT_43801 [Elsinoe ampelina]|uniref:Uncharacterized protein n=1 Tax=Elsinoe ampelina TaxID=302913 RepID=A0A6A6G1K1_9PEZI|nr:hypothetical protein BDZ85DRAFT_43801 [Elsinoe ampelina]
MMSTDQRYTSCLAYHGYTKTSTHTKTAQNMEVARVPADPRHTEEDHIACIHKDLEYLSHIQDMVIHRSASIRAHLSAIRKTRLRQKRRHARRLRRAMERLAESEILVKMLEREVEDVEELLAKREREIMELRKDVEERDREVESQHQMSGRDDSDGVELVGGDAIGEVAAEEVTTEHLTVEHGALVVRVKQ